MAKKEKNNGIPMDNPSNSSALARKPKRKKRLYRKRQTSIYFLLWAVFFVFSILIVALLWISQQLTLERTYKQQAEKEVSQKGVKIERMVLSPPSYFEKDMNAWLRSLSTTYDVSVFVLDKDGNMAFPFETEQPPTEEQLGAFNFSAEMKALLAHLGRDG